MKRTESSEIGIFGDRAVRPENLNPDSPLGTVKVAGSRLQVRCILLFTSGLSPEAGRQANGTVGFTMRGDRFLQVQQGAARRSPTAGRLSNLALGSLLATFVLAGLPASICAQQYKFDPVDDKANVNRGLAGACATGAKNYTAEKEKVQEFFTKYFFPSMTRYQPSDLEKLGSIRYSLFRDYLWRTNSAEMQRDVTESAFAAMRNVCVQPYHPAVRYNAVLIVGMLDDEYAVEVGANRRPPKPLPKANALLVQIVNAGAAGKSVPPAVLAGALVGLERHAKFREGLPRDAVEPMTAALLKIVNQDKPLLDMDRDVHAWMRLKAAGVLAQLGTVGANNQVHDGLVKLIADGRTLDDRCAAAALLEKLKYEGAKIDTKTATEKMLVLAGDVADAEAKRAEEFRERRLTGGGGYSAPRGGLGEGGYVGVPGEEADEYPRRHVVARLSDLKTGLRSLRPIVPADSQKKFDAILAAINPAIDATANKDTVSLNVANAVVTMAHAIKAVTAANNPAAAAAQEAAFDAPADAPPAKAPAGAPPSEPNDKAAEPPRAAAPAADSAPPATPPAAGN